MVRDELKMRDWRLLELEYPDATSNLAFDESLARHVGSGESPPTLRVWRNRRAAVIGENQSASQELHLDACQELGVEVVRRFTGGGAVYHDLGNLNYSVCAPKACSSNIEFHQALFRHGLECAVACLSRLGLNSVQVPVNTVMVGERKISGGAGAVRWGVVFYHGSVLVNTDLEMVWKVLRREQPLVSTGLVRSTRVAVTSAKEELGLDISIDHVKRVLREVFGKIFDANLTPTSATKDEHEAVSGLVREKYGTAKWNLKM